VSRENTQGKIALAFADRNRNANPLKQVEPGESMFDITSV